MYASDVIYLTDMKNLLDRLRNKDFDLPFFDPFDDENDKEYFFDIFLLIYSYTFLIYPFSFIFC